MRLVKRNNLEKKEPKYKVQDIAQAVGLSEGTIHGFFKNNKNRKDSTKDGLTLAEIVQVLERDRTRGEGINWAVVKEIRERLFNEYGYCMEEEDDFEQVTMA